MLFWPGHSPIGQIWLTSEAGRPAFRQWLQLRPTLLKLIHVVMIILKARCTRTWIDNSVLEVPNDNLNLYWHVAVQYFFVGMINLVGQLIIPVLARWHGAWRTCLLVCGGRDPCGDLYHNLKSINTKVKTIKISTSTLFVPEKFAQKERRKA